MIKLTEFMSKQAILDELTIHGATWGKPDFWDIYWNLVNCLPHNTQVGVALQLTGEVSMSEININKATPKTTDISCITNIPQHTTISYQSIVDAAIAAELSPRHAQIYADWNSGMYTGEQLATMYVVSERTIYRILTNCKTKIKKYVEDNKDWLDIYNQETARNDNNTNNSSYIEYNNIMLTEREFIEQKLNCETEYIVYNGEFGHRIALKFPDNTYILGFNQVKILFAALNLTGVRVYVIDNPNSYDMIRISYNHGGRWLNMETKVIDNNVLINKTKISTNVKNNWRNLC